MIIRWKLGKMAKMSSITLILVFFSIFGDMWCPSLALGRHELPIPSLKATHRTIRRAPKLGKKIQLKKVAKLGKKGANLEASH